MDKRSSRVLRKLEKGKNIYGYKICLNESGALILFLHKN